MIMIAIRGRYAPYPGANWFRAMPVQIIFLLLGLAVLTAGAEFLVRGGASLARRLGLTPLVVGLTVVAFGTSAPEMVVSAGGALQGRGDIAVGNVVGSNIFNIGVILGIAALISPFRIKLSLLKIDAPIMVAACMLGGGLALLPVIPRVVGALLVLLLIAYTIFSIHLARRQPVAAVDEEFDQGVPPALRSPAYDACAIAGGLALLLLGSKLLLAASLAIARDLGVSEAVIGLTLVSAGTSMPELATSIVAGIRRQSDIAIGNIIGSNIFNILGILGLSATIKPLSAPGIGAGDLGTMVAFSVALLPLLWTGKRLQRWEGALLLCGYGAYLWMRWPAG